MQKSCNNLDISSCELFTIIYAVNITLNSTQNNLFTMYHKCNCIFMVTKTIYPFSKYLHLNTL